MANPTTQPRALFCSFRFGGTDGVSVETKKWEWALRSLGFTTQRIAGEFLDGLRPDDTWLPFLAIDPVAGSRPEPDSLAAAIAGVDLVVVENLCSLPLNLIAAHTVAEVLTQHDGRVVFHHHDLPWERPQFSQLTEFPTRRGNSTHIVINQQAQVELRARGINAYLLRNAFDLDPEPGNRDSTRQQFGFGVDDLVILQPTRAIPRKEVGRGIALADSIAEYWPDRVVRFWISGDTEDGFDEEFAQLVSRANVAVTQGAANRAEDAYAAADLVVLPSSWEGFGNPLIEATVAGRPVVVAHYPVLDELTALGLTFLDINDLDAVVTELQNPNPATAQANLVHISQHFNLANLPNRIAEIFTEVGWGQW